MSISMSISFSCKCVYRSLICLLPLALFGFQATAQSVTITSPAAGSNSPSAVLITSSVTDYSSSDHLEIWDNGVKLGNVSASSESAIYVLPNGSHTTTVQLVPNKGGTPLAKSEVTYAVVESCTTGVVDGVGSQCNFDQQGIADPVTPCPGSDQIPNEDIWVGNYCGPGIQGVDEPSSINIQAVKENPIPASGYLTLDGQSIEFSEVNVDYSNAIFKADTPNYTTTLYSNWTLDEYVYLPNPSYNQALEVDAQYVYDSIWTKFYTECAFNAAGSGTGYWEVFDGSAGWKALDGTDGAPLATCDLNQFALPWSGGPSGYGWHHIVWQFIRNSGQTGPSEGSVTYVSVTFDGTTTQLNNYVPTSDVGGMGEGNNGDFSALVQIDGTSDASENPEVYVNELNIYYSN
jgi:hypothetical protein